MVVYSICNVANKKLYIGQTINKPSVRWGQHLYRLRRNTHTNRHLQSAFNKYGESSFVFDVLAFASSRDELDNLETETIIRFESLNPEKGYNKKSGGHKARLSNETRQKLSIEHMGAKNPMYGRLGELHPRWKPKTFRKHRKNHPFVLVTPERLVVIGVYAAKTAELYGMTRNELSQLLTGKKSTIRGFTGRYEEYTEC